MANPKKEIIHKRLLKLGLKENLIPVFFKFINEKNHDEATKIYSKLNVVRDTSNTPSEDNVLIKFKNTNYDVHIEIIDNEFFHFCSCSHRESAKGCSHAGAVLLYKMMKKEKNDFNSDPDLLLNSKEEDKNVEGGLGYLRDLFPSKKDYSSKSMIYFNFENFNYDSQLLEVERGVIKKDGSYGIPTPLKTKDLSSEKLEVSPKVKKLLTYLINEDSYDLNKKSTSGIFKKRFYDVNTDLIMPALNELFFEEQELILGATFSKDYFNIVWELVKNKDSSYSLKPFFVAGKRKTSLLNTQLLELGANSLWVFDDTQRCFYAHKESGNLEIIRNVIRFPKNLTIKESELRDFFINYYPQLVDHFKINISNDIKRETRSVIPRPKIYLEKSGSTVKVSLRFNYLNREIDYFSKNKEFVMIENDIIYDISRDFEEEDHIAEILNEKKVVTHEERDEFVLEGDLIDFIKDTIPQILESGIEVLGEDKLFNFKVIKSKASMRLDVSNKTDWFDIKGGIKFGRDEVELKRVIEAIFQNKRFIDLGDGKKGIIPKEWSKDLISYTGLINLNEENVKISKYHLSILESLISLSDKTSLSKDSENSLSFLKKFKNIESKPISKNLLAELRPYQRAGHDWLHFLKENDFNGILADDMGLGKTIQSLSFIQSLNDKNSSFKTLVIVPNSLVFNWKNEIEKFTPNMKVYIHQELKRAKTIQKFNEKVEKNDIIITTYGILRNDLELFSSKTFDYIVLDEAHMIKNPFSISAKCAYSLNAKNKLVISGTPIQNNLTELWSLFNFLRPGYLGVYDYFREKFVLPIEKDHDSNISLSLKKMIDPFILRRTKSIISNELPLKTEVILRCDLLPEEKEIYENWKDFYLNEINLSIKEKGLGGSKMKILEGLMKLRQICLHPKMIDPKYEKSSAKLDLLMQEIEKVLSEGHKVLVFRLL
jgi:hypothetical protein